MNKFSAHSKEQWISSFYDKLSEAVIAKNDLNFIVWISRDRPPHDAREDASRQQAADR